MDQRARLAGLAAIPGALVLLGAAGACALGPEPATSAMEVTSAPAAPRQAAPAGRAPFPELCGDAHDRLTCARVPLALPAATSAAIPELAAVERDLPGAEVTLAVRAPRGWVELPIVLVRTPPAGGEALEGRLVGAEASGPTLVVRVRTATRRVAEEPGPEATTHDLEESAWVCGLDGPTPACTRVRTASAEGLRGGGGQLAPATLRPSRVVRVEPGGRVVITPVTPPASR